MPRDLFENQEMRNQSQPRDLFSNDLPRKGFSGIGQDIGNSLSALPGALYEMISSLPGEAYASGNQIIINPSRAAGNIAGGAVKGLRGAANIPHNIREYLLEKEIPSSTNNPYPKFEQTAIEEYLIGGEPQPGDPLLQGLGQFTPYSRIGAGASGLKGLAQRSGGIGLMGVGDEEMDPIHAAVMSIVGEGAGKFRRKSIEAFNPKNSLIKGIESPDVKQVYEASERLGLPYVTPGEASGFGYIGKQEGRIGNTLEGSKLREKMAKQRAASEESVIDDFLNKLDDKIELPKQKQRLYDSVLNNQLPPDFLGPYIIDNPIVQSAVNMINTKPAYQQRLKSVKPDTFKYWDEVKRVLYDMESAEKRKGKDNLALSIGDTRKELIRKMDEIDPNYEKARKLGQRSILRREIEEGFDKKEMTGTNFYKNVIKSKSNFEKLYNDLSEFPDMQQQLLDMKTVFPNLMGTANAKALAAGERGGYTTPRNAKEWISRALKQQFNEKGDIKAVQAITSPEWYESFKKNEANLMNQITPNMEILLRDMIRASSSRREKNE